MAKAVVLIGAAIAATLSGCDERHGGYIPVSAIARDGFANDRGASTEAHGERVRLWGFVDHGNLYGDAGAKRILEEWWSGEGPRKGVWRFNVKAAAEDAVGRSFPVHIPNGSGRKDLLSAFVGDARAGRPTKVFLTGSLSTFDAPTQFRRRTGLVLELQSCEDVKLDTLPKE